MFAKVEYGEGNRPMCRFMLDTPVDAGIMNDVYRIDAQISEDMSTFYVWLVNRENGRVLFNAIRKKVPEEYKANIENAVDKAVLLAKRKTVENRNNDYVSNIMIKESIKRGLNEYFGRVDEHRNIIFNLDNCIAVIEEQWESPDDSWWIKIEQRLKDFKHFNSRKHLNYGDKGFRMWRQVSGPDGTRRENHVGYVLVKGNTKEECINSLKNAVVHLNDWAARKMGTSTVSSNGAMEGVIEVCNRFFARAYMTVNRRSFRMANDRAEQDKLEGKFKGRELHHRMGQQKVEDDATVKWSVIRPWGMIDCDVDNKEAQEELEKYLESHDITPFKTYESHDGKHYILKTRDAQNLDFSFLKKYNSLNRKNDPNCEFKGDANMIVYSPVGI